MTNRSTEHHQKKMKGKKYLKELRKLQGELCKLQEWIKHKGLRAIIVFEGRDGAGKGGTIKAITERVSPRVFRMIALPAPTEREKSQMYVQRYLPHLPAGGNRYLRPQLVQPRGSRAGNGFVLRRGRGEVLGGGAAGRTSDSRVRGHPDQILAG